MDAVTGPINDQQEVLNILTEQRNANAAEFQNLQITVRVLQRKLTEAEAKIADLTPKSEDSVQPSKRKTGS